MLYNIAITDKDEVFKRCMNAIRKALYSDEEYNIDTNIKKLPNLNYTEIEGEEELLKKVNESLKVITNDICTKTGGKYLILGDENIDDKNRCPFPFIERYHAFFLQRKWNQPTRDPQKERKAAELFRLHKDEHQKESQNYSKNSGDYNHFLNVIAATARLIQHLENHENVLQLICPYPEKRKKLEAYAQRVKFDHTTQGLRIFTLMLAAFFHDIGKTVVYHRHGMEGSIIISEHTSQSWYQLNKIAKKHCIEEEFERNDLLFISDMLYFHDQFGTLSTGEAGYLQLIGIIEKIKRYSLKYTQKEEQKDWSERYLFDLWVLNIADIMVSMDGGKYIYQKEFEDTKKANNRILHFIEKKIDKTIALGHDLTIANDLLELINKHRHTDTYQFLSKKAQELSDRHIIERIRRLVYSCIDLSLKNFAGKLDNLEDILKHITVDKKDTSVDKNLPDLPEFEISEFELLSTIVRSISATRNLTNFCNRFSWIGQMDYCLGFFESICSRALTRINDELKPLNESLKESTPEDKMAYCFRTKWIRDKFADGFGNNKEDKESLNKLQGKLFVENFVAIVVNILDHLLFREDEMNRIRNIEFNETRNRLTNEKIDAIISLDGPYHAKRSVQLILKTVFLY